MTHWTNVLSPEDRERSVERSRATNARHREANRELRVLRRAVSPYMTVNEFADFARCSRSKIDRLRKKRPTGFPREYAPAGRPLFKRAEVEAWVEAQPLW